MPPSSTSPQETDPSTWICFAVPEEAAFFRLQRPSARILITGIGAAQARRFLDQALRGAHTPPHRLLSSGFAGGLNPALNAGTVLFSADPSFPWLERLRKSGAQPGRFHCAPRVVCRACEKETLWQSTGADAVEMESAGLRALCAEFGIPSATVRVISDTATEDLPLDFNEVLGPEGRVRFGKLLVHLLKRPGRMPGLLRLRRQSQFAARQLAAVLEQVMLAIPFQ